MNCWRKCSPEVTGGYFALSPPRGRSAGIRNAASYPADRRCDQQWTRNSPAAGPRQLSDRSRASLPRPATLQIVNMDVPAEENRASRHADTLAVFEDEFACREIAHRKLVSHRNAGCHAH